MANRLNKEREEELQPKRYEFSKSQLIKMGFEVKEISNTELQFEFKGEVVKFFPYSGWHTGKTIKDGRGWYNLAAQLFNHLLSNDK